MDLLGGLAARQELLPPLGQRRRRHPELARCAVERLAPKQPEDRLRLPARREAPRLPTAVSGRRARRRLPVSLALAHGHLLGGPSCPPSEVSNGALGRVYQVTMGETEV